jgi:hypothetical protein
MRLPGYKDRLSLRNDQNVAGNSALPSSPNLSNADIADRLASLAQLLSTQKENPFKVKAYRRAAAKVRTLSESVDELVRDGSDLTEFAGIGAAISGAIREIVLTGTLGKLEKLRSQASPELASMIAHPRLDPKRVLRIYKKLNIFSWTPSAIGWKAVRSKRNSAFVWLSTCVRALPKLMRCCCTRPTTCALPVEEFLIEKCGVRKAISNLTSMRAVAPDSRGQAPRRLTNDQIWRAWMKMATAQIALLSC